MQSTLSSLDKTHAKLFIKHLTIQLTFGYHHGCHITRSKKENEIKSKKIFDWVYKFVAVIAQ